MRVPGQAEAHEAPSRLAPGPVERSTPVFSLEPTTAAQRAVLALALAVEACPFDAASGFTDECEPLDAWQTETDLFADGASDEALVWLLERGSDRSRTLAARKLADEGSLFTGDAGLSGRMWKVAAREKTGAVGAPLGRALASIRLRETGSESAALGLIDTSANTKLVSTWIAELDPSEGASATLDSLVGKAARDERPEVRRASAEAYATRPAEIACPAHVSMLDDADASVALAAARGLVDDGCPPSVAKPGLEKVVALIEKSVARGGASEDVPPILGALCGGAESTPESMHRAAALARTLTEPSHPTAVRERALRAVLACDPKGGKLVAGFEHDEDVWVRVRAKDLLKERKRKHRP